MARKLKTMDGNTAAAHVSYAFTEVAGIYPITPSSPMADNVDQWAAQGRKNIFGTTVNVIEMQSEAGAAGTVHGSLAAGALTTTYTASQGLLLMIPNMYKLAGELMPTVFHVSARTVATHALNIFGDHSDVMACRQTGFAMLCESNPQEVMDLGAVAHLAAIKGRVPFINFFDGFRTSHEIQKIAIWDNEDLADMVDMDAVEAFRKRALNPERPVMRGSHENGDIFFQHREAANKYYDALPEIVEEYMGKVNAKLGTNYQLFNYYGAPDADRVIIAMGSICDVAEEVIDYLNAHGEKVGLVKVRLYRPFRADKLLAAIPATATKIAVLDRTKEPGALGDPLYLDVVTAFANAGRQATIIGGRYGLGSKDTPPSNVFAVYEELTKSAPKRQFTVGIVDDVTHTSLEEKPSPNTAAPGTIECKFWGLGGDGTVGANKNSIQIIGDHTDKYVQAYFQYDSKKTGGVTISHLRFGDEPIRAPYYINKADFVACHVPAYIVKGFPMVRDVKDGGVFLINCQWSDEELDHHMPAVAKRYIAEHNIQVYTINAIDLAIGIGMGKRTNTILQSAFFKLAKVMPEAEAIGYMKDAATHSYLKKGQDVVDMNHKAIDMGATAFHKFEVPASWKDAKDETVAEHVEGNAATVKMVKEIMEPVGRMDGDSLPVSAFANGHEDGTFCQGASAYEKRGVAVSVPEWDQTKCIQCNQCSYVCPHATIRPYALTEEEAKNAPAQAKSWTSRPARARVYTSFPCHFPAGLHGLLRVCEHLPRQGPDHEAQESQAAEQEVFDYMVAKVAPRPTWRTPIPSRAASSSSPCWSSPAPAPAAPRPPMPAWSPRSAATVCIFPTPPAVPPSGAARLPPPPTPSTRRARVPPGPTPCSRITPSTALACTWARRPSAAAWPTRPAPCWPWSGALQPLRRLPRSGWIPWRTARPTPRPPRPTSPLWRTACARWTSCWPAPSPRSRRLAKSCRPRVRSSASVTPASWPLRFSRRRSIWLRSPCGSRRRRLGLRHRLRRPGSRHRLRRGRQHLRLRYRGLFQHRRTGLQVLQYRPGGPVCRRRQEPAQEEPCGDRHAVRLRLRGPGGHGRQPQPDSEGHHRG